MLQRLLPDTAFVKYSLDSSVDDVLTRQYRAITPDAVRSNLTNPNVKTPVPDWGQPPVSETAVSQVPSSGLPLGTALREQYYTGYGSPS